TADGLQVLAPLVEELRRERARADAGGVRLDDAQRGGDAGRADAGTDAGAAGGRVGGRDERVGAVVDVEHGGLAALHEDALALVEGLVEHAVGVDDHRAQAVSVAEEVLDDALRVDGLAVVHLDQDLVLHVQRGGDLLTQDRLVEDVLHADADAVDLVGVGRADAAAGGADGALTQETLLHAVEDLVVRGDEVGVRGDAQALRGGATGGEAVDLLEEGLQVDDDTVAEDRDSVLR